MTHELNGYAYMPMSVVICDKDSNGNVVFEITSGGADVDCYITFIVIA